MKTAMIGAAFALLGGQAALAADQFDLVCKGTRQSEVRGGKDPYEVHYRIDLAAKRYCQDDCAYAYPIESITADQIMFESNTAERAARGQPATQRHGINRTGGTGFNSSFTSFFQIIDTTCEPAPFSGLPKPKF